MERACADDGLSSKISGLSGLLSISSILSLVLLVFPRPSKGSVWESTQTHVGAGTRALLGPRASASRRRALRGAARGGADAVSRFPLLAPEARCGALRTLFGSLPRANGPWAWGLAPADSKTGFSKWPIWGGFLPRRPPWDLARREPGLGGPGKAHIRVVNEGQGQKNYEGGFRVSTLHF